MSAVAAAFRAGGAARLPAWSGFAAVLAAAGLPIYIHAPKFYVDSYGVGLGALGLVLFGLRLLDVVQDPALGWLAERAGRARSASIWVAAAVMAAAMLGLFAVAPPMAPLAWFALCLAALFSAFSYLTISFYAAGVGKAATLPGGHVQLAAWRETGALLGVSLAALAPAVFAALTGRPFAAFALAFAAAALLAAWAMRGEWRGAGEAAVPSAWRAVLADATARRLLWVALANATPVAVTSTLFLFFVESRLAAPGWEGPLLLLFFLAAAAAAPGWAWMAQGFGARRVLLAGMVLSILAFLGAAALGPGDVALFALVCLASGAALGADMTLLPALFARRLAQIAPRGGQGFGLWSFVTKFTLALAAVTLLPLLDVVGFRTGAENGETALAALTLLYALVPCALKLLAIGLLLATPLGEED